MSDPSKKSESVEKQVANLLSAKPVVPAVPVVPATVGTPVKLPATSPPLLGGLNPSHSPQPIPSSVDGLTGGVDGLDGIPKTATDPDRVDPNQAKVDVKSTSGGDRYEVSHPGLPSVIVQAKDRHEAIQKYRDAVGITSTSQEFIVSDRLS